MPSHGWAHSNRIAQSADLWRETPAFACLGVRSYAPVDTIIAKRGPRPIDLVCFSLPHFGAGKFETKGLFSIRGVAEKAPSIGTAGHPSQRIRR